MRVCTVVIALLATACLFTVAGCVGVKYLPIAETDVAAAEAGEGCWWAKAVRDGATDQRLFLCCEEADGPVCTEVRMDELEKRQLRKPFRNGKPTVP